MTTINTRRAVRLAGLTMCAALLASAMTAPTFAFGYRTSILQFSGAVALPGVTLPAGAYMFEIANPNGSGDVVLVRARHTMHVKFLGFTRRVERPSTLAKGQLVSLGEARRGEPVPIVAWYPTEHHGYEFIYR